MQLQTTPREVVQLEHMLILVQVQIECFLYELARELETLLQG